jgi:hypothetical protein
LCPGKNQVGFLLRTGDFLVAENLAGVSQSHVDQSKVAR